MQHAGNIESLLIFIKYESEAGRSWGGGVKLGNLV